MSYLCFTYSFNIDRCAVEDERVWAALVKLAAAKEDVGDLIGMGSGAEEADELITAALVEHVVEANSIATEADTDEEDEAEAEEVKAQ